MLARREAPIPRLLLLSNINGASDRHRATASASTGASRAAWAKWLLSSPSPPPAAACRHRRDEEENVCAHLSLQLRLALGAQVARLNDGCQTQLIESERRGKRGVSASKERGKERARALIDDDASLQSTRGELQKERRFCSLRKARSSNGEQRFQSTESCGSFRRQEDGDRPRPRVGAAAYRPPTNDLAAAAAAAAAAAIDEAPLSTGASCSSTSGDNSPAPLRAHGRDLETESHCGTYPSCEFKKESLNG